MFKYIKTIPLVFLCAIFACKQPTKEASEVKLKEGGEGESRYQENYRSYKKIKGYDNLIERTLLKKSGESTNVESTGLDVICNQGEFEALNRGFEGSFYFLPTTYQNKGNKFPVPSEFDNNQDTVQRGIERELSEDQLKGIHFNYLYESGFNVDTLFNDFVSNSNKSVLQTSRFLSFKGVSIYYFAGENYWTGHGSTILRSKFKGTTRKDAKKLENLTQKAIEEQDKAEKSKTKTDVGELFDRWKKELEDIGYQDVKMPKITEFLESQGTTVEVIPKARITPQSSDGLSEFYQVFVRPTETAENVGLQQKFRKFHDFKVELKEAKFKEEHGILRGGSYYYPKSVSVDFLNQSGKQRSQTPYNDSGRFTFKCDPKSQHEKILADRLYNWFCNFANNNIKQSILKKFGKTYTGDLQKVCK